MIKLFRSIAVLICFAVFGIGALIISFLIFPVIKIFYKGKKQKDCFAIIIRKSWRFFTRLIEWFGIIKVHIKDLAKLKNIENKVIVSTHPSFIDIVILISLIPKSVCFAKKELMNNIFMKNIISNICISSGLELEDMIDITKKYLDNGYNIIIFPMGRRHKKDEFPRIKKGATAIAMNANKNIQPIKITNDYDFLQIGQSILDAGDKTINYYIEPLEEINIKDFENPDRVTMRKEITDSIANTLYCKS